MYTINDFYIVINEFIQGHFNSDISYEVSLKVLKNNHSMIKFYYEHIEDDIKEEERYLRVYGLLQALFVSIDALYQIATILTHSKSFISINDNPRLKELKYIRNDVVGHPTNRIVNSKTEYCILDPKDITLKEFSYRSYFQNSCEVKDVSVTSLIEAYYNEATKLLKDLIEYINIKQTKELEDDIYFLLESHNQGYNIYPKLKGLKKATCNYYSCDNRIIKRINLISDLIKDGNSSELTNYLVSYLLSKLYLTVCEVEGKNPREYKILKETAEIKECFKLFKLRPYSKDLASILHSSTNPKFKRNLLSLIDLADKLKLKKAKKYFERIRTAYNSSKFDYVYALAVIFK